MRVEKYSELGTTSGAVWKLEHRSPVAEASLSVSVFHDPVLLAACSLTPVNLSRHQRHDSEQDIQKDTTIVPINVQQSSFKHRE